MGDYLDGEDWSYHTQSKEEKKWERFKKRLMGTGLGCFSVEEFPMLLKFFEVGPNSMNNKEIEVLRNAVARSEKLLKSLSRE